MTPLWIGFISLVFAVLWFDLAVLHRRSHVMRTREALTWTGLYVGLALLFAVFIYFLYEHGWFGIGGRPYSPRDGWHAVKLYLTGYVVEESLSLDNIFVMALIFGYFSVPREHQHRTLFWGILGAILFRGLMIGVGTALIHRYSWMLPVFGVILLITALRMLFHNEEEIHPDDNPLVKAARRIYPVTSGYQGQQFFSQLEDGRRAITPLFLVLLVIESTDIVFAVDSIPAIFGITSDPFLVFSSNIFAILGLRALYFVLAGFLARFQYMKPALVGVLLFIAVKMLLPESLKHGLSEELSIGIIFGILALGVVASLLVSRRQDAAAQQAIEDEALL